MPEPISSNNTPRSTDNDWATNHDNSPPQAAGNPYGVGLTCEAEPDVGEPPLTHNPASAVGLLVAKNPPAMLALFLQSQTSQNPSGDTNNNSQRTSSGPLQLMSSESGTTSAGDSVYAGAALIKGPIASTNVEVASASGQVGAQTEFQVGAVRVTSESNGSTIEGRAFEVEVHAGVHNPDGSTGANVGAGATLAAAEYTFSQSGNSVTAGLSLSVGAEFSVGRRDADSDGKDENCIRLGLGPVVVAACVEFESIVETARDFVAHSNPTFVPGGTLNP